MNISPGEMEDRLKPVIDFLFKDAPKTFTAFEVMNDVEAARSACTQVMKRHVRIRAYFVDDKWHVWFNTPVKTFHDSCMELPVAVSRCLYKTYVGEKR